MTTQEQAIRRFQKILQVPTVSRKDDSTDWAAFDAFLPMLKEQFPRVFEHCELSEILLEMLDVDLDAVLVNGHSGASFPCTWRRGKAW